MVVKRIRRTYMLDKSSLVLLKEIKEKKSKLIDMGLYLKSESDIINYSIRKFGDSLKEKGL